MANGLKWTDVGDLASERYIDSRDMEEAIVELEAMEEAAKEGESDSESGSDAMDEDLAALLAAPREVRDSCGSEWRHGVQYIRRSEWVEYAQQLAEDVGAIDNDAKWLACHIDWQAAADALEQGYSTIDIGNEEFLYHY